MIYSCSVLSLWFAVLNSFFITCHHAIKKTDSEMTLNDSWLQITRNSRSSVLNHSQSMRSHGNGFAVAPETSVAGRRNDGTDHALSFRSKQNPAKVRCASGTVFSNKRRQSTLPKNYDYLALNQNAKKSSIPLRSNYWENCELDKGYDGLYRFNQDQFYEGEFFRDSMHGQGTYTWKESAVYEGGFYSNYKEGYACVSFVDGSYFEGLFIKNQPFGPGILTHASGRQDAGFWLGKKLVRLSRAVDFIIPRLAPTSAAKIKLLQFRRLIPLNEKNYDSTANILKNCGYLLGHFSTPYSSLIYDSRSIFFDKQIFEKTFFINVKELSEEFMSSPKDWANGVGQSEEDVEEKEIDGSKESPASDLRHWPRDVSMMKCMDIDDDCGKEILKGDSEMGILSYFTKHGTIEDLDKQMAENTSKSEVPSRNLNIKGEMNEKTKDKSKAPKIVSWNRSDLCTEMLKQIFRYRAFEEKLTFNLAKLMLGVRTAFRRTGEMEKQCLEFLKMCSIGPPHVVKDLLCNYEISEELMDARGNNSLMFAAASDQHDIIDILLDYGVDVNTFNDESLTPLNLCLLRRLAQTNGISNWETAFLPKELDRTRVPDDYDQTEEWQTLQSIPSLDRIFGDGMSINDSKTHILDSRFLSQFSSPSALKETNETLYQQNRISEESKDLSNLSQITVINISRSPGSYSLMVPCLEDETQDSPRSTSLSFTPGNNEFARAMKSGEPTPKINIKLVPKSNKRDEFEKSITKSSTDKYFFEFSFEKTPNEVESKKKEGTGKFTKEKASRQEEQKEEKVTETEGALDLQLTKKIAEIDKTIEKLLKRGADPNISEVPKPSIHLGVHTKDLNTIYILLLHGASPDCQLYSNEGLLTPLHVVVLQKSAPEYVDICELLLNFGANPEEETAPEFSITEEEKDFLDLNKGRTPLELLCMRPDLEHSDPENNLIKIGLMLAKVSKKRHFYNGHSCLTLAMLFGNLKLLKALLESKYLDPNDVLEKDRGTALYVLVSRDLQKKTTYETSIKMCDLLIAGGANVLKKFTSPENLLGTCIDYGYREIQAEKEARKVNATGKKDAKKSEKTDKEKTAGRDYLKDHERVVEYLSVIASNKTKKKGFKDSTNSDKKDREVGSQNSFPEGLKTVQKASRKSDKKIEFKSSEVEEESKYTGKKATDTVVKTQEKSNKREFSNDSKGNKNEKIDSKPEENKKSKDLKDIKDLPEKTRIKESQDIERPPKKDEKKGKEKDTTNDKKAREQTKVSEKGTDKNEIRKSENNNSKKDLEKESRNIKTSSLKLAKSSVKNLSVKCLGTHSETFPEKLRQTLLRMYGTCGNVDVNEFLVPYVVLRDGELYYRFQGKVTDLKEQYSLI